MPRLPTRTPKEVIQVLEQHGFVLDHVRESHHVMVHFDKQIRITVPVHGRDLPKGTLNAIIKASGLSRSAF